MPPSPSMVAMQEGWETDESPAPQAAEQPQGPREPEPPTPAVGGEDEGDQAYYEVQLHVRFLGPLPEGRAAVSRAADEAHWALTNICEQAIKNRDKLTFAGIGHGIIRKDK